MRKQILTAFIVLTMLLCGCSMVSTIPDDMDELVAETEVTADENSFLPSESTEMVAPEESEVSESTVTSEMEEVEPPKEESKPKETTSAATAPENNQSDPASAATSPATEAPKGTPQPAETLQPTPEETKPKSAYDYEFDIEAIKADCIAIGKAMGLNLDTSLTPSNAASWNPVTASQNTQGTALKQSLEKYIKFHTVENLGSYGIDSITDFNIYCEPRGNGAYSIYFLFA